MVDESTFTCPVALSLVTLFPVSELPLFILDCVIWCTDVCDDSSEGGRGGAVGTTDLCIISAVVIMTVPALCQACRWAVGIFRRFNNSSGPSNWQNESSAKMRNEKCNSQPVEQYKKDKLDVEWSKRR